MDKPRPYVPPDARRDERSAPAGKPWMALPDATHRCWKCGVKLGYGPVLDAHEKQCDGTPAEHPEQCDG